MEKTLGRDGAAARPKAALNRVPKVKNKAPAPIQITAEQILLEARATVAPEFKQPRQVVHDAAEMGEYRQTKRSKFEERIKRNPQMIGNYIKYARWEEEQTEYDRSRSIFERAIGADPRNVSVYQRYVEFEMRHKMYNHARNVWDRAVTLLPRVDQMWLKYALMEEGVGNPLGARQIFQRWMQWLPGEQGWLSFIKFELRYSETERAREVYKQYIMCHPDVKPYLRYARFEEKQGEFENARAVYQRALEDLAESDEPLEELYLAFATFEERCKEFERARVIFRYALDNLPREHAENLYQRFVAFEKKHGDRLMIEEVILGKRRFQYEEEVAANPRNYDAWFDYARLEESAGDVVKVRAVYERAVANLPPVQDKRYWRRYIYLWINYALFEELEAKHYDNARAIYKICLQEIVPHKVFSFSKLWIMYAHFEVRRHNLDAARKILGHAIGMCPKEGLFKQYIQLELQLGNIDRCRVLYEKYIDWSPSNCQAWIKFATLESSLGEVERARAVYELAVAQPVLDLPEMLWRSYIDFETESGDAERARGLYERLLERTQHVKVWISYAQFLASRVGAAEARELFNRANQCLRGLPDQKEERVLLLETWRDFEHEFGDAASLKAVQDKQPKRIKKRRPVYMPDGTEAGFEEYYDYLFPDEQTAAPNLKILEMAHRWKRMRQVGDS